LSKLHLITRGEAGKAEKVRRVEQPFENWRVSAGEIMALAPMGAPGAPMATSNGATPGGGKGKSLLQVLGESKKITHEQAREAMSIKAATTKPLEEVLIDIGVSEVDVYQARATMMNVQFLDLNTIKTDPAALPLLPEDLQSATRPSRFAPMAAR
jgi:hypothetical protein